MRFSTKKRPPNALPKKQGPYRPNTGPARASIRKRAALPGYATHRLYVYGHQTAMEWFERLGSRGMGELLDYLYALEQQRTPLDKALARALLEPTDPAAFYWRVHQEVRHRSHNHPLLGAYLAYLGGLRHAPLEEVHALFGRASGMLSSPLAEALLYLTLQMRLAELGQVGPQAVEQAMLLTVDSI